MENLSKKKKHLILGTSLKKIMLLNEKKQIILIKISLKISKKSSLKKKKT
jgi:hypothetical protein